MKLILIRHGETEENVLGIHQGQTHGRLSARGLEQAKKLALLLKNEEIDVIITSDLARATDTAAEVAKYHKARVIHSREIREKTSGILDGKRIDEYLIGFKASGKSRIEYKAPGGENYVELLERARTFLERLLYEYEGKTVLVCSHGGFNIVLLGLILNRSLEESVEILDQRNACVNMIEFRKSSEPVVHAINCVRHLE